MPSTDIHYRRLWYVGLYYSTVSRIIERERNRSTRMTRPRIANWKVEFLGWPVVCWGEFGVQTVRGFGGASEDVESTNCAGD